MANSAYTQWDNLRKALKNSKIEPNGKIATILLDCFINLDGKLRVPLFREKGLCQKSGEFYEMRKKLKSKGWLEFDTDAGGKLIRYYPGKKLIKYINIFSTLPSRSIVTWRERIRPKTKGEKNTTKHPPSL